MLEQKKSINEKRIRAMAIGYYSRPDIRREIVVFAKNRECVPRYFEGFGKRPDTFQFDSDILELVKRGATSFHSSEELWKDPLEIQTGMSEDQLNDLRKGWDLLIDIDAKYFDYAKIYAEILIKVLNKEGIKNIGAKFSGSKGFHIIVPWKAFPKELSGRQTKDMFPEWPRLICKYLGEKVSSELKERIIDLGLKTGNEDQLEVYCTRPNCNSIATKTHKIYLLCPYCGTTSETFQETIKRKRKLSCPNCLKEMQETRREPVYICESCNTNSQTSPNGFKERIKTQNIDADIVLVSSRHLFRMPYSLHEKTSLASIVIDPEEIKNFDLKDANYLKIKNTRNFIPDSKEGEATKLLINAIENQPLEPVNELHTTIEFQGQIKPRQKKDFKKITIPNLTSDLYPPTIKTILKGMPSDGRKRALFILLNYLGSLELPQIEIDKIIEEWNKKNYEPLRIGYLQAQLKWHAKTSSRLPPNYNKPYYREIGLKPTAQEIKSKNPVSYTIRIYLAKQYDKK